MFDAELKRAGIPLSAVLDEEVLPGILKRISFSNLDDMYAAIGYGGITATRTVNRIKDELQRNQKSAVQPKDFIDKINEQAEKRSAQPDKRKPINGILVEGLDNCLIKFSKCCTPVPGDDIIGFITRGAGISIHRKDCPNYIKQVEKGDPADMGRWIRVEWAESPADRYVTALTLESKDRVGLLLDVASAMSSLGVNVLGLQTITKGDTAYIAISMEVKNAAEIKVVTNKLLSIRGVTSVTRAGKNPGT